MIHAPFSVLFAGGSACINLSLQVNRFYKTRTYRFTQFSQSLLTNWRIDREDNHGLPTLDSTAQVHGADIDLGLSKNGTDFANQSRAIVIMHDQHMLLRSKVCVKITHLDNLRCALEERAGN